MRILARIMRLLRFVNMMLTNRSKAANQRQVKQAIVQTKRLNLQFLLLHRTKVNTL